MLVGLDFGTTNSIISSWDKKAKRPVPFQYNNKTYTPSIVAYEKGQLQEIGDAAFNYWENNPEVVNLCRFFKTLLTKENREEWEQVGWNSKRNPVEVTRDYIQHLLLKSSDSIAKEGNKIEQLVVSVPELWQKQAVNVGANNLEKIIKDLGLPLKKLVSEPVAAIAYYVWKAKIGEKEEKKILVCDMGGGTFDVSYCVASKNKITVKAFEGSDNNRAGVYNLQTILNAAYKRNNRSIDIDSDEYKIHMWKLDQSIQSDRFKERLGHYFPKYKQDKRHNQTFPIKGLKIHYSDLDEAFNEIDTSIKEVLNRLTNSLGGNVEFDQLLLVGGFSQYFLVRETILKYFGLKEDSEQVKIIPKKESLLAISMGACLIAANKVEIKEFYPHSIYYMGKNESNGKKIPISIIGSGQEFSQKSLEFYAKEKIKIYGEKFDLEGYILVDGDKKHKLNFKKEVRIPKLDYQKQYSVGIEINESNNASFIVKDYNGKEYRSNLGELFRKGIYILS